MSVLDLTGEESNYLVLEKVLTVLKEVIEENPDRVSGYVCHLVAELEVFLILKRKIVSELDVLTHLARHGDKEAAIELIRKLAEQKDGP